MTHNIEKLSHHGYARNPGMLMHLQQELSVFYAKNGLGKAYGSRPLTVLVYVGCMLVPLPNIKGRRRYLKYHDLHHLITDYSVGRIGEGEVSAWELGTGSALASPTLAFMNLIALSTGLMLDRHRMWRAFVRGTRSKNLYSQAMRTDIDAGKWQSITHLRVAVLEIKQPSQGLHRLRYAEFAFYSFAAMVIHACIAIPALIARLVVNADLKLIHFCNERRFKSDTPPITFR